MRERTFVDWLLASIAASLIPISVALAVSVTSWTAHGEMKAVVQTMVGSLKSGENPEGRTRVDDPVGAGPDLWRYFDEPRRRLTLVPTNIAH